MNIFRSPSVFMKVANIVKIEGQFVYANYMINTSKFRLGTKPVEFSTHNYAEKSGSNFTKKILLAFYTDRALF